MADKPNINVFGLKMGASSETSTPKPEVKKSTSSTAKNSGRSTAYGLIKHDEKTVDGTYSYRAATNQRESEPFKSIETLTKFGIPIQSVSFGDDSWIVTGKDGRILSSNLPQELRLHVNSSPLKMIDTERHVRLHARGGWSFLSNKTGPPVGNCLDAVQDTIRMCTSKNRAILDVAIDSRDAYIVVANGFCGLDVGTPKSLQDKFQELLEREEPVLKVPYFEGESWFIQTEKNWYSANLPQALYKCLSKGQLIDALAVLPDGQWILTYQNKAAKHLPAFGVGNIFNGGFEELFNRMKNQKQTKSSS